MKRPCHDEADTSVFASASFKPDQFLLESVDPVVSGAAAVN